MNDTHAPQDERELGTFGIIGFILLLSVILLRAPLTQSFWLDETVTFWVTSETLDDTIHRSIEYQGQSPLYFVLLHYWRGLLGESELALRSLSLLFTFFSFTILYRLARILRIREVVSFVLIPFLSLEEVTRAAFGARPYALGLVGIVWSFLALVNYCERRRISDVAGYIAACLLAFYSHYLFALVGVVQLAILWSRRGGVRWMPLLLGWGVLCLACSPGLYHILLWMRKSETITFNFVPTFLQLLQGVTPRHVAIYFTLSIILGCIWTKVRWIPGRIQDLGWVVVAMVCAPLGLYILSIATGGTLFVDRYYLWRAVGVALFVGIVFSKIDPRRARGAALVGWLFFAIFLEGLRQWQIEEWRQSAQFVRQHDRDVPILLYSGLIESEQVDWEGNIEREEYITSPFRAYPAPHRVIPIPSNLDTPLGKRYYDGVLQPILQSEKVLVVAYAFPARAVLPRSIQSALEANGFVKERGGGVNVHAALFTRGKGGG